MTIFSVPPAGLICRNTDAESAHCDITGLKSKVASEQGLYGFKPKPERETPAERPSEPSDSPKAIRKNEEQDNDQQAPAKPRRILCAQCSLPITHTDALCQIGGDSEHRCLNPAGLYFHIQCFLTAPGCMRLGPATDEYCWFPGYQWQLAYCHQCQAHLGWHYEGRSPAFFGLIKDRLRAEADASDQT